MKAEVIPGVSSIQILAARLGRPWQDWNLVSAHGVACDPVAEVMKGKTTCFLTGGKVGVIDLCKALTNAGLGNLSAVLAEDLTYETENLSFGTVRSLVDREIKGLNLLLVEAAPMLPARGGGYPDSSFERGKVPMTKREVRAVALAKLGVATTDTVWDIGAGTGRRLHRRFPRQPERDHRRGPGRQRERPDLRDGNHTRDPRSGPPRVPGTRHRDGGLGSVRGPDVRGRLVPHAERAEPGLRDHGELP